MNKIKIIFANLILFIYAGIKARRWKRSTREVENVQSQYLFSLLDKNKETMYGLIYGFSKIDSIKSFQENVPLCNHDDILPYIDLIKSDKTNILTKESVYRFGVSSGSTKASKLIPYTKSLSDEFQTGISPWFWFLFKQHPSICLGRTYWSISPVGQNHKFTVGGIPIGFDDEQMYFSKFDKYILDVICVGPKELSLIKDIEIFRYVTLLFLLAERNLSWVSIWNPTFITLIFSSLDIFVQDIINDIRNGTLSRDCGIGEKNEKILKSKLVKNPGRANEISRLVEKWKDKDFCNPDSKKITFYEALWPNLKLISCWADGEAKKALPKLKSFFPNAIFQPKGLIATEAFVSFPLNYKESALSINSHFFEFEIDDGFGDKKIKLTHELEVGKKYEVIVTTGGGLYRYRLNDVVLVVGFKKGCPLVKFLYKKDKVVDVVGEKMNENFVKNVVSGVLSFNKENPDFWLVAPERLGTDCISYTIFIHFKTLNVTDAILKKISKQVDDEFLENYHYNYSRKLGQLGKVKIFLISDNNPEQKYLTVCAKLGQRLGDIKNTSLHSFDHWSSQFEGRFV